MNFWIQAGPSVLAAFLASLVEFVEALTIVLAVGVTRGWRPAMVGTFLGVATLIVVIVAFGPILQRIPIANLQLIIGVLLLMFGLRWLRKAILRSAGVLALHDEDKIFEREKQDLKQESLRPSSLFEDPIGVVTAFKAVLLEGLEVVFIVLATGVGAGSLLPSILGASLAGLLVLLVGFVVHRPLSKVPENKLKFSVGLILSSFGIFWVGEGLHYPWPGEDLFILVLLGIMLVVANIGIAIAKPKKSTVELR